MAQRLFPKAWVNGRVLPLRAARIRTDDAGLLFGWGVFETLRAYGGVPFDLNAHLRRMRQGARRLGIRATLSAPRLKRAVRNLLKANRVPGDAAVRITLTRGPAGAPPALIIHARRLDPDPDRLRRKGLRACTLPWHRTTGGPVSDCKTLNYLEHALGRDLARRRGCDEGIYVDPGGRLLEGTWSSLFLVTRGRVRTPALKQGILPGITRARVLRIVRALNLPLTEGPIPARDLFRSQVFVTSSSMEVQPVRSVDGRRLKEGGTWRRVWERYRRQVTAAL